jgi:hypothetical protein
VAAKLASRTVKGLGGVVPISLTALLISLRLYPEDTGDQTVLTESALIGSESAA